MKTNRPLQKPFGPIWEKGTPVTIQYVTNGWAFVKIKGCNVNVPVSWLDEEMTRG